MFVLLALYLSLVLPQSDIFSTFRHPCLAGLAGHSLRTEELTEMESIRLPLLQIISKQSRGDMLVLVPIRVSWFSKTTDLDGSSTHHAMCGVAVFVFDVLLCFRDAPLTMHEAY